MTYTSDMIRKYRKEKRLTQKKLGELSGLNEVQIRQYELGNANPKLETLQKIATALKVPVTSLRAGIIPDAEELKEKVSMWGIDGVMAQNEEERLIIKGCRKLNSLGQKKAIEQMELLTQIPKYQKDKE